MIKHYYARIRKNRGVYLVEFPELNGCLTEGKTLDAALKNAEEALNGFLASHCDRDLDISEPRNHRRGRELYPIAVNIKVAFAIHLRRLRMTKGLTQGEVARRLGISQQAYAKFESPTGNPSLETLKRLSDALEANFEVKLGA